MKFRTNIASAKKGGIAWRLFICTAALALVPSAIIAYFSYAEAKREIIDEKVSDMKQISTLRMEAVSSTLEELKTNAMRFADSRTVGELLNTSSVSSYENFSPQTMERLSRNGFLGGAILDISGNVLASADMATYDFFKTGKWRNFTVGKTFEAALSGASFSTSELSLDTPSGQRGMNFAVPVKNPTGKISAVVLLYVDISKLQDALVGESKNFKTSEIFICAYVGNSPYIIAGANADGTVEPAFMGVLAKTLEGAKISPDYKDSGYSLARDFRGNIVVAAWDYIPQLDWYVIMKTNLDEVISGIQKLGWRIATVFFVAMPLALVACIVFAKVFASPISALLKRASIFSVSEMFVDTSKSEPQMLAASIDSLKDALGNVIAKSYRGASEILTSSEKLSDDISHRAEISRQIESSSDKIILHSQKIADVSINLEHSVEQVDNVSEISVRQAESALDGIEKMNKLMSGLEQCAQEASSSLAEIFGAGRKIGEIVDAMTQLADRANLLSLNASIEAKKAGVEGAGFSVVAGQLRKLADQTSTSTLEIERIVRSISALSDSGVKKVRDFDSKFSDVAAHTKTVSEVLAEIIQKVQGIPPRLMLVLDGIQTQSKEGAEINSYARSLKRAVEEESKLIESAREISDTLANVSRTIRRESGKYSI